MKVRITYNPDSKIERVAANLIGTDCKKVLQLLGAAYRVKERDGKPPYRVIYVTAKTPDQSERGALQRGSED